MATPFQYAAVVCTLAGLSQGLKTSMLSRKVYWTAVCACSVALIALRVPNVIAVERAFAAGEASAQFNPDFNRLAQFATARSRDAIFIAADWGTGAQIYCAGNGKPDLIYEPFWNKEAGATTLELMKTTRKSVAYVVVTGISPTFSEASASILRTAANAPDWKEGAVEADLSNLHGIKIRKFVRG
jgi:hypothetical protein